MSAFVARHSSRLRTNIRRTTALLLLAAAALMIPAGDPAAASGISLSNGPTVVRGKKSDGSGNWVQMAKITAIPNATSVDAYMTVGPDTYNPYAYSSTEYDQAVNAIPDIRAFSSYAANNWINVRGNHYYDADVNNVHYNYK